MTKVRPSLRRPPSRTLLFSEHLSQMFRTGGSTNLEAGTQPVRSTASGGCPVHGPWEAKMAIKAQGRLARRRVASPGVVQNCASTALFVLRTAVVLQASEMEKLKSKEGH